VSCSLLRSCRASKKPSNAEDCHTAFELESEKSFFALESVRLFANLSLSKSRKINATTLDTSLPSRRHSYLGERPDKRFFILRSTPCTSYLSRAMPLAVRVLTNTLFRSSAPRILLKLQSRSLPHFSLFTHSFLRLSLSQSSYASPTSRAMDKYRRNDTSERKLYTLLSRPRLFGSTRNRSSPTLQHHYDQRQTSTSVDEDCQSASRWRSPGTSPNGGEP